MKKPIISIIIPVYKVEEYLAECLESILAQTFKDFEAVCIDDGSPDNCGKILDAYALKDKRIKVIHQENGGEAVARNRGLDEALGDYIYFVDDDDYLHPQTLEVLYSVLVRSGAEGAACRHDEVYVRYQPMNADIKTDKVDFKVIDKPLQKFLDDKKMVAIAPWCKLYKRSAVGNTRFIKGIHFDDVPFNIFMLHKIKQLAVTEQVLYFFYQNPQSVSHTKINLKKVKNYLTIIRSIYNHMTESGDTEMLAEVQKKCFPTYVNVVMGGVKKMKKADAAAYQEMLPVLKEGIKALLAEKIIRCRDFKLRKRWQIFKLLYLKF